MKDKRPPTELAIVVKKFNAIDLGFGWEDRLSGNLVYGQQDY